jgi:Bacterial dnaA protein helix-turn-helix
MTAVVVDIGWHLTLVIVFAIVTLSARYAPRRPARGRVRPECASTSGTPERAEKTNCPDPKAMMARICRVVAARYGVPTESLLSATREQPATTARHVAMRLCRELTDCSYSEIGRFFARDHTTVLYACKATDGMRLEDLRAAALAA